MPVRRVLRTCALLLGFAWEQGTSKPPVIRDLDFDLRLIALAVQWIVLDRSFGVCVSLIKVS